MRLALLFATVSLLGSIAVIAQQPRTAREHDARWTAPSVESARTNPLSGQPTVVAGGRKLFQQRCSTCHGEDGAGTAGAPDLTRSSVRRQSDGALFWKITSGNTRTGMPTFSFLPPLQRWQLVLYVRSLSDN
jgi:mono/diheme cytochrome c family protein